MDGREKNIVSAGMKLLIIVARKEEVGKIEEMVWNGEINRSEEIN
jgi:hypothetical protein